MHSCITMRQYSMWQAHLLVLAQLDLHVLGHVGEGLVGVQLPEEVPFSDLHSLAGPRLGSQRRCWALQGKILLAS